MIWYTDQLGKTIGIKPPPKRIVSLVPSQTELLFDLGLNEEVVGITKFCIHPEHWFRTKTRVGGTKQLHLEKIKQLNPDLIIASKEENVQTQIEELEKYFPVWVSDINNFDDALEMIEAIGKIVDKPSQSTELIRRIKKGFTDLQSIKDKIQACYLIWKDPYMTIGGDTFINNMMEQAGFENAFKHHSRYPQVTIQQMQTANCQLIMLSSEPYPFKQKHIEELQREFTESKMILVDGEMFSWYGSRLIKAAAYFLQLHNQVLSLIHGRGTE